MSRDSTRTSSFGFFDWATSSMSSSSRWVISGRVITGAWAWSASVTAMPVPGRLEVALADVVPVEQLLEDVVPRALRAEAEALHLLDERALGEPARRLGLVLREPDLVDRDARAHGEDRERDLLRV